MSPTLLPRFWLRVKQLRKLSELVYTWYFGDSPVMQFSKHLYMNDVLTDVWLMLYCGGAVL